MTAAEVRRMVEAVSDRCRALVVLLAGSGLRPAEALGLAVDRVDFLRRTVRVARQLVTLAGQAPSLAPPSDRTPHDLRHDAASVLIDQGASVKAVQRHLGHASATTTLYVSAHLWPEAEEITRRALAAGLEAVVSPVCHGVAAEAR